MTYQRMRSCSSIYGMPPANGISVNIVKIVKSYGTHRTLSMSFPSIKPYRTERRPKATFLDVNRPAPCSLARLLWWCYIYACRLRACTLITSPR